MPTKKATPKKAVKKAAPKRRTAKKAEHMLVTFLLDRSSSMSSCKPATIEAFNAYITGLQDEKAKGLDPSLIEFTFLQFDSISLDKVCIAVPAKRAPKLTDASYQPRGGTPLIDAAYNTIMAVEASLAARKDKPKVVICIQTDGEENSSTQHSWTDLRALIERKQAEGWEFNFMGAGIDAYQQGARMGIRQGSTVSYDHTKRDTTVAAYTASASNARMFGANLRASAEFLSEQKMAAGDAFDPDRKPLAQRLQQAAKLDLTKPESKLPKIDTVNDFTL